MNKFKKATLLFAISLLALSGKTNEFEAGDIAIVSVSSNEPKSFEFLALVNISAGTKIYFTDAAWIATEQQFRDGEGTVCYTAPEDIEAGATIAWTKEAKHFDQSGSFELSASGDNIICFQNPDEPRFIYGVGWAKNTKGNWEYYDSSSGRTSTSDIPSKLTTENYTISYLGNLDSYAYCDTALHEGSKAELLYALSHKEAFIGDDEQALTINANIFTLSKKDEKTEIEKKEQGNIETKEIFVCPDGAIANSPTKEPLYYDDAQTIEYSTELWQGKDTILYDNEGQIRATAVEPEILGIFEHGTYLVTEDDNAAIWFLDGAEIGSSESCDIKTSGTYFYKKIDENGCIQQSQQYSVKIVSTGTQELGNNTSVRHIDILGRELPILLQQFYIEVKK